MAACPAVTPYLRRVGERVVKSGGGQGRMKLGGRLPDEVMTALRRVFPNAALDVRLDGTTVLRLDRLNMTEQDALTWVSTLCEVLSITREKPGTRQARAQGEMAVILERCRLLYPEMAPVWERLGERAAEWAAQVLARDACAVQEELLQLAGAVRLLMAEHDPLGPAELSARCFGDSKALKNSPTLARRLEEWLLLLRGAEESDDAARRGIWAEHGVVENATAIKVTLFGPLCYEKDGERFDWIARMHAHGETATLSWDNLRGVESLALPPGTPVITCENETPFASLVRDGVPGLLIYTAGYPNSAVRRLLRLLRPQVTSIRHWGDSDLDGLRIAEILAQSRPVQLWRCDVVELQRHVPLLLPLSPPRQRQAADYLAKHPDFPFRDELAFTVAHGWLEQERWGKAV